MRASYSARTSAAAVSLSRAPASYLATQPDQVTAEPVPTGKPVRGVAGKVLLDNLALEFDRVGSMLGQRLSPRKHGPDIRFSEANLSITRGALHTTGN